MRKRTSTNPDTEISRRLKQREPAKLRAIAALLNDGGRRFDHQGCSWAFDQEFGRLFQARLREFVESWLRSGRRFWEWRKQQPRLAAQLDQAVRRARFLLLTTFAGATPTVVRSWGGAYTLVVHPVRLASDTRPYYRRSPAPFSKTQTLQAQFDYDVAWIFSDLITSPFQAKFKSCVRCGRFFVGRGKVYCSQRCGSRATAEKSTEKRRKRERKENLWRARRAYRAWKLSAKQEDPKRWTARETGLSLKWLTRAENKYGLKIPKGGKRT